MLSKLLFYLANQTEFNTAQGVDIRSHNSFIDYHAAVVLRS